MAKLESKYVKRKPFVFTQTFYGAQYFHVALFVHMYDVKNLNSILFFAREINKQK